MTIPETIRDDIRARLWAAADSLRWSTLPDAVRAKHYEFWTRDPAIGGRLGHFMDPRKVRVYIKDSLIKPYERSRLSRHPDLLSASDPCLIYTSLNFFLSFVSTSIPEHRTWGEMFLLFFGREADG